MDNVEHANFKRFLSAIRRYAGDAKSSDLLIAQHEAIACYYAPIDWKNPKAKVMVLGITPGQTQANNALKCAQYNLARGADPDCVLAEAKREGAFSGAMRPNLVTMLDHIGLNRWLGLRTCGDMFGAASELLQSASVLPYPVYVNGDNYNGTPNPVRTKFLSDLVLEHFVPFLDAVPEAVIVPLGPVPTKVVEWLAGLGKVSRRRILSGLPHPSGANAERIAYFVGTKKRQTLSAKTDPAKLDAARARLMASVSELPRY